MNRTKVAIDLAFRIIRFMSDAEKTLKNTRFLLELFC